MKVQHDHEKSTTLLSLGCCKRLRPLAPKLEMVPTSAAATMFDLKSFIKPECGRRNVAFVPSSNSEFKKDTFQTGGTRWNPTEEQIGVLEALYTNGIRTPTAIQIDHITAQLSKYGKIEGKNVFYWFQNHKARERQRRRNRATNISPTTTTNNTLYNRSSITLSFDSTKEEYSWKREEQAATPLSKRKCTTWTFESSNNSTEIDEEEDDGLNKITLHLFPLHPETR